MGILPKLTKEEEKMSVTEYLEYRQMGIIKKVEGFMEHATPEDNVKLKACSILLNKVMPDRTKMDLDIKSQAPYEQLSKYLEKKED